MPFHVPFNQRHRRPPVVYIGFDQPRRPRKKFNWWGFNGLVLSLAAFATAGALSPIALLVNMKGLKRRPRKLAVAGTFFSLVGTGLLVAMTVGLVSHRAQLHQMAKARIHQQAYAKQCEQCEVVMASAIEEFTDHQAAHDELPKWIEGNMLMIKHVDPWGQSLRYDAEVDHAIVRSAGPDSSFDTADDLTKRLDGKLDREVHVPVHIDGEESDFADDEVEDDDLK